MEGKAGYRPNLRLRVLGTKPFFGPGTATLLRAVAQCGSLAAGCQHMGLSYSKGRGMVRTMEKELGYPVMQRTQGGAGGGSARLTPEGERLLEAYTQYEADVRRYAERRFIAMGPALGLAAAGKKETP